MGVGVGVGELAESATPLYLHASLGFSAYSGDGVGRRARVGHTVVASPSAKHMNPTSL